MRAAEFWSPLPVPAQAPQIENDGIIGNINGLVVQDGGESNPATTTEVINNTFAYNTTGLVADNNNDRRRG